MNNSCMPRQPVEGSPSEGELLAGVLEREYGVVDVEALNFIEAEFDKLHNTIRRLRYDYDNLNHSVDKAEKFVRAFRELSDSID